MAEVTEESRGSFLFLLPKEIAQVPPSPQLSPRQVGTHSLSFLAAGPRPFQPLPGWLASVFLFGMLSGPKAAGLLASRSPWLLQALSPARSGSAQPHLRSQMWSCRGALGFYSLAWPGMCQLHWYLPVPILVTLLLACPWGRNPSMAVPFIDSYTPLCFSFPRDMS